jgi:hypothetical protein
MSRFINAVLLGIIVGVAAYWFVEKKAREHPEAERRFQESAARAREAGTETAHQLSDALKAKFETLNLGTDEIKDELARTGKIFRRRAKDFGEQVTDAAVDARVVAAIKAKYLADSELSAWKISVACDQGHVTLTGTVSAPENIGKAVALALETDGVRDVTSSLNVKPNA